MPEDTYPTPLHSASYDTGPVYLKYLKVRKDWASVTLISRYEDGGIDTNTSADNCLQEYRLSYNGLTDEDANILDQFWDAHKLSIPFTFIEPRDHPWTFQEGETVTGCRFISYDKDHADVNGVKLIQKREVVIGKYPS
jgi:hypothetical protein